MQIAQLKPKHIAYQLVMQNAYSIGMSTSAKTMSPRNARRRERLEDLIREIEVNLRLSSGGATRLAMESDTPKSHISAILAGKRGIGDVLAEKWEQLYDKDPGWFDQPLSVNIAQAHTTPRGAPTMDGSNVEDAGRPARLVRTPVVGTARMGEDGYYEEIDYPVGHGDGWVESYSSDLNVYALRVKGDSMHPAIRHGSFVVVEPNGQCVPGEYVVLALRDGRKMVKELVIERSTEIVIESVNGNHRQTLDREEIDKMHPVAAIVSASRWRES